jgi:hypothetical protein
MIFQCILPISAFWWENNYWQGGEGFTSAILLFVFCVSHAFCTSIPPLLLFCVCSIDLDRLSISTQNAWDQKCFTFWSFSNFRIFVQSLVIEHPLSENLKCSKLKLFGLQVIDQKVLVSDFHIRDSEPVFWLPSSYLLCIFFSYFVSLYRGF